jgi:hypothetical protein
MMDIKSFIIGVAIGGVVLFLTGFLKKAGEDFYSWAKRKISPKSVEQHSSHMTIHINKDGVLETAQDISKGRLENPLLERVSTLSIDDIINTISKAPPLQRDQVAKNYIGLKIEWDTLFKGGKLIEGDLIRLHLSVIDAATFGSIVWCVVPAKQYPELAILPTNSKVRIYGEIEMVESYGVDIKDAHLHIYGKP